MNRRIRNQACACAFIGALAISVPAFSDDDLHIAAAPSGVQGSSPECKARPIYFSHMELKACRKPYVNMTPNSALTHAYIYTHVAYPPQGQPSMPFPLPNSYVLWSIEVRQGDKILFQCEFNGMNIYLKRGETAVCAKAVYANLSASMKMRVVWHNEGAEDGNVELFPF